MKEKLLKYLAYLGTNSTLTGIWGFVAGGNSVRTAINYGQGENYGWSLTGAILSGILTVYYMREGIKSKFNTKSSELEKKVE